MGKIACLNSFYIRTSKLVNERILQIAKNSARGVYVRTIRG